MTKRHTFRLTRRSAETAMDRRGLSGSAELDSLLSDAAAPARAGELSGEGAALVAFQQAHLAASPVAARTPFMKRRTSRLLTAKILAVGVIGLSGTGGLALAAGNGHLPGFGKSVDAPNHGTVATERPTPGASVTAGRPAEPVNEPADDDASGAPESPKASPSPAPSLEGLCTAFAAATPSEQSKRLESPALSALVEAAGGAENVETFCIELDDTTTEDAAGDVEAGVAVPGKAEEAPTTLRRMVPTRAAVPTQKEKPDADPAPIKTEKKPTAPAPDEVP